MSKTHNCAAEFYDAEAAFYDRSRYESKSGRRMDRFHKLVLEKIRAGKCSQNALELGCGTGRLLPFMAKKADTLTGIDVSPGMLEVAQQRKKDANLNNVRLILGNAVDMPFPDNHFDMVYSVLVINLIKNYTRVFCEVRRVLKDGGVFLLSVPNIASIYFPAGFIVNQRGMAFGKNSSGHRYSHWFSMREIKAALSRANFTVEMVLGQPPWTTLVDNATPMPDTLWGRLFSKSLYIRAKTL